MMANFIQFELHQIEHIRDSWDLLIEQVKCGAFNTAKYNFCNFYYLVAEDENEDSRDGFRHMHRLRFSPRMRWLIAAG